MSTPLIAAGFWLLVLLGTCLAGVVANTLVRWTTPNTALVIAVLIFAACGVGAGLWASHQLAGVAP